jgi:hypothetical protein
MSNPISDSLVCDFNRSFIRWRHDTLRKPMLTASRPPPTTLNNVRMPVECLAVVSRGSLQEEFALGTSCKTEQVFVERDVWMQPNADMCAALGAGQFLIIKRWDRADKGEMLYARFRHSFTHHDAHSYPNRMPRLTGPSRGIVIATGARPLENLYLADRQIAKGPHGVKTKLAGRIVLRFQEHGHLHAPGMGGYKPFGQPRDVVR